MSEWVGPGQTVRVDSPARHPTTDTDIEGVALVTIDRPELRNALDRATMRALLDALIGLDADDTIRCIVLTGAGDRAFAAGADVSEMVDQTSADIARDDFLEPWDRIRQIRKPLIAAVRGYALGGGFELALCCDLIVCGDDAVLGLPEVGLGIMPGAGGTQRLTRAVGKYKAMDIILTGARLSAAEADARGLVSRMVPAADTIAAALDLASIIAGMPPRSVIAAVAAIDDAMERGLGAGVAAERAAFARLFDTHDQKEGMRAFLDRRRPEWKGR